ncbi:MAG: HEAT repeat domain-containing protein [Cyclobacteriaceae bacterium]|nr:HEAT repeat domain-containing protein [Cyclobacteriaceae bacterium]
MDKEKWESRLIDYIDGKSDERERMEVAHALEHDPEVRQLYQQLNEVIQAMDSASALEPSGKLKAAFEKALEEELAGIQSKKIRPLYLSPLVYRIAAGFALVILSVGIGYWVIKNQERERELADLRKQVEDNRNMMLAMIDNQQSASQRMKGVSVAYEFERADDEIVSILVKTMNEDVSTNVRLAALEALSKFMDENRVRTSLIQSLSQQKDPVVQIALIQLLVKMKEKGVIDQLEKITKDASTMKAVKDEAYSGILKLS